MKLNQEIIKPNPHALFGHVYTTRDYSLFTSIDGNRNKNLLHINRLKKSIEENYLFTVITINEKYEIIDGQHRFEVIKELKLPLHYIICEGYGLNEVHVLNQISKTWNSDDYLNGYCNLGYIDYLKYREFKDLYGFGHGECVTLLSGKNTDVEKLSVFHQGKFKIGNYSQACKIADNILRVAPFYQGYKRRSFIYAMIILLKNKNFDFEEFLHKVKSQPLSLVDCTNQTNYISLIEDIYNYRRRDKVNLRYNK